MTKRMIIYIGLSGVQRLLDARGQRGSWMPSKIFSIHPAKFQMTIFYQLSNFSTIRSLDAPSRAASCPGNDIFLFIFFHLPTFFYIKLAPWMPPRVDARGRRTVRTALCTPLCRLQCRLLPPPPPLQITRHHLHPSSLSVTTRPSTQN